MENILMCQDIIKYYNRSNIFVRCLMKIDLRKVYDLIRWDFIDDLLKGFCFFDKFRKLLMECIIISSFFISCNGGVLWIFKR